MRFAWSPWVAGVALSAIGCSFQGSTASNDGDAGADDVSDDSSTDTGDAVDPPDAPDAGDTPDASPLVDTDGDGLVDSQDNCVEIQNADQRDHEADGLGDVCDPCPHLPGSNADADADGIGDACDPRPGIEDRFVAFYGFYPGDTLAGWTQAGTWSISAEGYLQPGGLQSSWQYARPPGRFARVAAATSMIIESLPDEDAFVGISIETDDESKWHACGVGGTAMGTRRSMLYGEWTGNSDYEMLVRGQDLGETVQLMQQTVPGASACSLSNTTTTDLLTGGASPSGSMGTSLGVDDNAVARFDYLFVVELAPGQ